MSYDVEREEIRARFARDRALEIRRHDNEVVAHRRRIAQFTSELCNIDAQETMEVQKLENEYAESLAEADSLLHAAVEKMAQAQVEVEAIFSRQRAALQEEEDAEDEDVQLDGVRRVYEQERERLELVYKDESDQEAQKQHQESIEFDAKRVELEQQRNVASE